MGVSVVGTPTSAGSSAAVTTITVNKPSVGGTVSADDTLLWVIVGQSVTIPSGQPTGFSATAWASDSTTGLYLVAYTRLCDGSEGSSFTSQTLTSARTSCSMICYRGVDTTTPKDAANATTVKGTTTTGYNSFTGTHAGAWAVGLVAQSFASGVTPGTLASGNMSVDGQGVSTAGAAINVLAGVMHLALAANGFNGTASNPSATTRSIGIMTAFRPATISVAATLAMTGTFSAAGSRDAQVGATLAVTGSFAAAATREAPVAATLAMVGSFAADATRTANVGATLAVIGTLSAGAATSTPVVEAAATLDGVATLTAGMSRAQPFGATLAVLGTLTAAGGREATVGSQLAMTASVAADAFVSHPAVATLAGLATFQAGATLSGATGADLALVGELSAGAEVRRPRLAAFDLEVVAELVAGLVREQPAAAVLAGLFTIEFGAIQFHPAPTLFHVSASAGETAGRARGSMAAAASGASAGTTIRARGSATKASAS